jgi:CubicO group peptidase (beta-lactamase class C family)
MGQLHDSTILEMMQQYGVSALSMVEIDNYQIKDSFQYGTVSLRSKKPVTPTTVFQAASISKSITSTVVMKLVESGLLDLQTDVNHYFSSLVLNKSVTLRQLLSHTAGVNVGGFPGYLRNQKIPTLKEVINGAGNSPKIQLRYRPGKACRYSGGGFILLQQLLEDLTKKPYAELVSELIFRPFAMKDSSFDRTPLSVTGYYRKGKKVILDSRIYPESAAAGLLTMPTDLGKWMIELQKCFLGQSSFLKKSTVEQMFSPVMPVEERYAICLGIWQDGEYYFHRGGNDGFNSRFVMTKEGSGIVIMDNCNEGYPLIDFLIDDWKNRRVDEKSKIDV